MHVDAEATPSRTSAATPFAVVARFPDMAAARRAIESLQNAGIEAGRIALTGDSADAARASAALRSSSTDLPIFWRALLKGFWWGVWGALAGALIGVFVWWADIPAPGFGESLALQVATWAMYLHVAAAICGLYAGIGGMGDAWELSFQRTAGPVDIGVRVPARDIDRVARILRDRGASSVSGAAEAALSGGASAGS